MYRISLYTLLLFVVMLLQIFIFDRLTLSVAISPIVYITFLALLPIQTSQLEMLFWSVVLGVIADFCMGMAGVNTIATLFVGYTRIYMMNHILGKDMVALGGVPDIKKIGHFKYLLYIGAMTFTLSIIFFGVESLNLPSWQFTLKRCLASGAVSLLFVWLLSHLFGSLLTRKV